MRYRLIHVSDLHAGPPHNPGIAAILARQARAIAPDLMVISGDFVQRADFPSQWRTIKALVSELPRPQLVVPGNHDVPLFNVAARLFWPLRAYRRHISPELNPVFERPGLVVAGAVTAHGLTVDGGRLSGGQVAALRRIFLGKDPDACKVVVWHHPLVNPPGIHKRREMRGAEAAMRLLDELDIELLLCGHIHVSYVGNTLDVARDLRQGTIICQSGTSTSRRGYGRERGKNSFNLIEIDERAIRISQHLFMEQAGEFVPVAEHIFPRRTRGVYRLPESERVVE